MRSYQDGVDVFAPDGRLLCELFSPPALRSLDEAVRFADQTRWDSLRSPHVFMGLLATADPAVALWAQRLGAHLPSLVRQFCELFQQDGDVDCAQLRLHREFMSDNVLRLLRDSWDRANICQRPVVTTIDLMICVLSAPHSIVAECFERVGIRTARLTELALAAEQHAVDSFGT